MPLSRPPAISTIGGVERAERRDDGVGLRALRVVDEADAVDGRDRLEPVLDARERRRPRARIASGASPNRSPTATAASALRDVVGAGDRELARPA